NLLERSAHLGISTLPERRTRFERSHRLTDTPLQDGRRQNRLDRVLAKSSVDAQLPGTHSSPTESTRKRKRQTRVLRFIDERLIRLFDELCRSPEREQLERKPSKSRNRRVL